MSTIKHYDFKIGKRNNKRCEVNVEYYNSAQDVAKDCETRTITDASFNDMQTRHLDDDWHGVNTYTEALDLLRNGYQPVVEKLSTALKVNRAGNGKRITFKNDIAGFAPVVPLALKGVPNSMISTTMKPIKCKVIDVYYDITVNCGTNPEEIIENGQLLLAAIIDLEKQGYRFNLYAVQSYNSTGDSDVLCVKVKSSDKPIDLKRMSFPLTHPAFFRVIGFDWYSKCPVAKYRGGYGHALRYDLNDEEITAWAQNVFGDNAVFITDSQIQRDGEDHLKEVLTNAGKNRK